MRVRAVLAILAIGVLATGCTPKIDGSSELALRRSLEKVIASVPEAERTALMWDIQTLAPEIDGAVIVGRLQPQTAKEVLAKATAKIHGLTAGEIRIQAPIARAEEKARQKAVYVQDIQRQIAYLSKKLAEHEAAHADLGRFKATIVSTLSVAKDLPYGAVELDVTNGMSMKAHRVWYKFTLDGGAQDMYARSAVLFPGDIPAGGSGRVLVELEPGIATADRPVTFKSVEIEAVEGDGPVRAANLSREIERFKAEIKHLQEKLEKES